METVNADNLVELREHSGNSECSLLIFLRSIMITWPDLVLPPINLYTVPYYEPRCKGDCDRSGKYCKGCGRYNYGDVLERDHSDSLSDQFHSTLL